MDKKEILARLKTIVGELETRISLQWETDECTECYRQGMEDATQDFYGLIESIQQSIDKDFMESLSTSNVIVSEKQKELPLQEESE